MDMERSSAHATSPIVETVPTSKQQILARSAFDGLMGESRAAFLDLATVERLPRRHAIVTQGDPTTSLLLLGSGRVKVERLHAERAVPLGHRGPGHMIGENALSGASTATESASVLDEVEALVLPIAALQKTLAADAPLRAAMAAAIVQQHREQEQRLMGLLLHGVEARLASFLLDASLRWGKDHAEGTLVSAPFTHAEIAQLIGSTRETVTLVLGKLKREAILAFDRRRLVIRDRAQLELRAATAAG
jgi:CRP-like cAMP-binding protein